MDALPNRPDEIFSYAGMCAVEGLRLRRGMNFRTRTGHSIILTSERAGAPYADQFSPDGRVLIYEGHDVPRSLVPAPKAVDQLLRTVAGGLTENGKFWEAAERYKRGAAPAERVRVWEKLGTGQWLWRGEYCLVDAWTEERGGRRVILFRLERIGYDVV